MAQKHDEFMNSRFYLVLQPRMLVHTNTDHLPMFRKAVLTIGTFDGVHLGHQQIIRQLKSEAIANGGETVIVTFHPHPRKIVKDKPDGISLLNTLPEKIKLLESHGIDHLVVVPFTPEFSTLTAEQYVTDFLVRKFRPAILIIGYDHRFGQGRSGNYELLEEMGPGGGFEVKEIPEHILNTVTVSSTRIRQDLKEGKLAEANQFLGYPYGLSGTVVEGDRRGRTIGFPTANLRLEDEEKLIPADGVYAVTVSIGDRENVYRGMMNIGFRPTVGGTRRSIEIHIINFSEDIYGSVLHLKLHHYVRREKKFSSLEELKAQLIADQGEVVRLLT
ncbi:MAG TPA: bifunctional riboflavin kinase/FAD synthetase, partial [Chitinophagaceae bacterium]|nr:bifunctional riboflavin kinase/FAD synthetase [Chitinophagaceae bacterium]